MHTYVQTDSLDDALALGDAGDGCFIYLKIFSFETSSIQVKIKFERNHPF